MIENIVSFMFHSDFLCEGITRSMARVLCLSIGKRQLRSLEILSLMRSKIFAEFFKNDEFHFSQE